MTQDGKPSQWRVGRGYIPDANLPLDGEATEAWPEGP